MSLHIVSLGAVRLVATKLLSCEETEPMCAVISASAILPACMYMCVFASLHLSHCECTWASCWMVENRLGSPPAESQLDAIVTANHWECVSCVCGGCCGGGEMGPSLSGPPHMKGKLEPLIAVLTQGGSKGRPLRKAGDPGGINGPQHNWPHYRNKHAPQNRHTQTWWSLPALWCGLHRSWLKCV